MQTAIIEYLEAHPAEKLLWIADNTTDGPALTDCVVTTLPVDQTTIEQLGDQHYDCAVLQDLPGSLGQAAAEQLVARLRDVQAQRILWLLDGSVPWERKDLLALGFRLLDGSDDGQRLYGYDIDNYKTTPDWLNAKHWANPELWGKYRW